MDLIIKLELEQFSLQHIQFDTPIYPSIIIVQLSTNEIPYCMNHIFILYLDKLEDSWFSALLPMTWYCSIVIKFGQNVRSSSIESTGRNIIVR